MKRILITAFDAFGGETINPSWEAVQRITPPPQVELIRLQVPTVFGESLEKTIDAIRREKPDVVLCIGQAGGRGAVTPERVALNLMDASIPDNVGTMPVDVPVVQGGENALFATVPVKRIVEAIRKAGIPGQLSNTAGTFVCNQLLYGVLSYCQAKNLPTQAGFIHVPYLPEQAEGKKDCPSLSLEQIVTALEAALACVAES